MGYTRHWRGSSLSLFKMWNKPGEQKRGERTYCVILCTRYNQWAPSNTVCWETESWMHKTRGWMVYREKGYYSHNISINCCWQTGGKRGKPEELLIYLEESFSEVLLHIIHIESFSQYHKKYDKNNDTLCIEIERITIQYTRFFLLLRWSFWKK